MVSTSLCWDPYKYVDSDFASVPGRGCTVRAGGRREGDPDSFGGWTLGGSPGEQHCDSWNPGPPDCLGPECQVSSAPALTLSPGWAVSVPWGACPSWWGTELRSLSFSPCLMSSIELCEDSARKTESFRAQSLPSSDPPDSPPQT